MTPKGLVALRQVFVTFSSTIVLIGVVVALMPPPRDPSLSTTAAVAIVVGSGVLSLVGAFRAPRPLDCSTPAALASSYRARFFLRMTFGESASLVGFVFVFVSGDIVTYLVGAAFTGFLFAKVAPTKAHVASDQRELRRRGCDGDLIAALG